MNFDKFIAEWGSESTGFKPPYHKPKKEKVSKPQADPMEGVRPHNVWDVLTAHGIERKVVEGFTLEYNNLNRLLLSLKVTLVNGDRVGFKDIQMYDE